MAARASDTDNGYGWISILLHWTTAVIVLGMLFIGSSIQSATGDTRAALIRLHTSIGICAYALLWVRVVWRFMCGHPGPRARQRGISFTLGKYVHLSIVAAIGLMLLTGPLIVWTVGGEIEVFGLYIPAPATLPAELYSLVRPAHRWGAILIFAGTVLHLLGVIKHITINRDGTFEKIMVPATSDGNGQQERDGRSGAGGRISVTAQINNKRGVV